MFADVTAWHLSCRFSSSVCVCVCVCFALKKYEVKAMRNGNKKSALPTQGNFPSTFHFGVVTVATGSGVDGDISG